MIVFYLIGFLLVSAGIVILLGITPEVVTNDMMKFISPKQTLRDKAQIAKGRKKSRRITKEILHIKEALEVTGKGKQFTIACAASVVMLVAGCFLAVLLNNLVFHIDKADLDCFIAVVLCGLNLSYYAGTCLKYGYGNE